jgi:tRNA A-37 threonylcarbamoyl transferase component Bud32
VTWPAYDTARLTAAFRRAVLWLFVRLELFDEDQAAGMRAWPHPGFHAHTAVWVPDDDRAFAKRLARYCARSPVALERLTYDRAARACAGARPVARGILARQRHAGHIALIPYANFHQPPRPVTPDVAARLSSAISGRYRLERELGRGGMATVYLAADLRHKRKVALKVLKPELAAVLGAERFVHEITTTAALQHPHILPLFDSGSADGFLYYVMPFIDGETLRQKLDRETQLGIDESVKITVAVADALDYAHRHGVVHRDIKPENILLHDGRPMVADFGIALALSAAAGGRMTETGMSLGTPHYMSPEQATADKEITGRSDVYSLASVLYEMLAGQPPHLGGSAQQIIMKIITEPAQPVTALRRSVPANVAAALATALEKLPADRFATAAAYAAALENSAFSGTTMHQPAAARRASSWRGAAIVAALAALVLLIAAVEGWRRPPAVTGRPWRIRMVLPDSTPLDQNLSLAADGSSLVYDAAGSLWLRRADRDEAARIPGTQGATVPSVSPSGRRVAFLRSTGSLEVIGIEGGSARVLIPHTGLESAVGWTDDEHVVYAEVGGLIEVPVAGGATRALTAVDSSAGEVYHITPRALPDHQGVVFIILPRQWDSAIVAVVGSGGGPVARLGPGISVEFAAPSHLIVTRLDGSIVALPFDARRRRITGPEIPIATGLRIGAFTAVGRAAVSPGGRLIYVSAGASADEIPADLVWISRDGRPSPAAPGWVGAFQSVAIAPDGRRAAAGMITGLLEEIQVRDLASGSTVTIANAGNQLRGPAFSPDGRWLYFAELGATRGIYRVEPGGAAPPELVVGTAFTSLGHTMLAGSGDELYYDKSIGGTRRILRYSLSSRASAIMPVTGAATARPRLSPDGRWLAFLWSSAGRTEIHVRSADSTRSEEWRVADYARTGTTIRWSHAGDELFYVAGDSMYAARVSGTPTFTAEAPRALFATTGLVPDFDLGSDGRFLMIRTRPDLRPPTEVTMLERWMDLLPR